jgi:iron complex outermembrane receptor protein
MRTVFYAKARTRAARWLAFVISGSCWAAGSGLDREVQFDIPAQALVPALYDFSSQAKVQVITKAADVSNAKTAGVSGRRPVKQALAELLRGTGFSFEALDASTIAITPAAAKAAPEDPRTDSSRQTPPARMAQADQGTSAQDLSANAPDIAQASQKKPAQLEQVVVTGSRLVQTAPDGAQDVQVYSKQEIDQSGQTTVADFLSTLSAVSVSSTELGFGVNGNATTVQLHGLPIGTTLVLLNGRRLEVSGLQAQSNFFDLNSIPAAAVERIEVVSGGSSAVYGSDAIAGVVNIILAKDLDGVAADFKYGGAAGTHESDADMSFGKHWDAGSFDVIATWQERTPLVGADRAVVNGPQTIVTYKCSPGNVFTLDGSNLPGVGAPYAAIPRGFTGTPSQAEFAGTAGTLNSCGANEATDFIPRTSRKSVFASGELQLAGSVVGFTELLFSDITQTTDFGPTPLIGEADYAPYTVSADNPFNPFGETVGIGSGNVLGASVENAIINETKFFRPLLGARGDLGSSWHWEAAAWTSYDRSHYYETGTFNGDAPQAALNQTDPSLALNPFVDGPGASPALLNTFFSMQTSLYYGQKTAVNAFARGTLLQLPGGPAQIVVGGEYDRDKLTERAADAFYLGGMNATYGRDSRAAFTEARIPIFGPRPNANVGDRLTLSLAARYDSFSDFGDKVTPQFGGEWRPLNALLLRATFARAFKAPSLYELYSPVVSTPGLFVTDPERGNQGETVNGVFGGNPELRPETGKSHTAGFVYSLDTPLIARFEVSYWSIEESNSIQSLPSETIIDNPQIFGAYIVRAPTQNGVIGPITTLYDTEVNFGNIQVSGIDYHASAKFDTGIGKIEPSLSLTETLSYLTALTPQVAATNRDSAANDDGNWAPRWKGSLKTSWTRQSLSMALTGRYIGRYQDYDTTNEIGNFWLFDANLRYSIPASFLHTTDPRHHAYVEIGGVNILNRLPQSSNFGYGQEGYDPLEGDIRGRFLYARLSLNF